VTIQGAVPPTVTVMASMDCLPLAAVITSSPQRVRTDLSATLFLSRPGEYDGGELVVDYALRFKAKYGWSDTWIAGYSNDVFGYVPSRRVLKEGGYEGGDALINRPFPGPFAPEIEEVIANKVDELVQRVRRP